MAGEIYTIDDLINAYRQIDPGKVIDVNRVLSGLPNGGAGGFTIDQLRGMANLQGLSNRSMTAFQSAIAELGNISNTQRNAQQEDAALQESLATFRQARALAAERANVGRSAGGEISNLSRQFLKESTPLRKALIGSTEARLGLPVSTGMQSPVALFGPSAPERAALETGFANARRDILENTPARGGQLNRALMRLPEDRARALSAQEALATDKAVGLATDIGLGGAPLALQGLQSGAGVTMEGLGGAAGTNIAAGSGITGVASGYNAAASRSQQFNLATMALAAQERAASGSADAAKKGSTGQGAGAGAGAILGAVLSNYN